MGATTPLERMLEDAWREPGLRPAFYKRLLDSLVFVAVQPKPGQGVKGTIDAGECLNVISLMRKDGVEVIPFYSSPEKVFDGSPMGERCVRMTVRELFESRRDLHFHLNPFSPYGREFTPWEVASLLSTGGIAVSERIDIPDHEDADLRAPQNMPEPVLAALRVLFARNLEIRAAYIAERMDEDPVARLLIVVDLVAGGDQVRALREAGTVITETHEPDMPSFAVALLPREGSAMAQYFQTATPFYKIGLAGSIASALRPSRHRG